MEKSTVWINVTTTSNWYRPVVGVVRVEQELSVRLPALYGQERCRCCVWRDGKFEEYFPESAAQEVPVKVATDTQQAVSLPLLFPILPRKAALMAIAQGGLSLVPARTRPWLNSLMARLKPGIGKLYHRLATRRRRNAVIPPIPERVGMRGDSLFRPGDILLSVGLDWDSDYYQYFYTLQRERGVRVVTCCYDLIPVLYPQYCVGNVATLFTSYFIDIAEASDLIICISRQSEKDLKKLLYETGSREPTTHVFPLGDNIPAGEGDCSSEIQQIVSTPFILFVSTIERRKNHEVLYRAYHLLCAEGKREQLPRLVFVGMQGWGVGDLLKDIELDPLTQGLILQLNHVSDSDLRYLYEKAIFCVYPSLYEGWGLPVGEALAMGKAVLASGRGSLPEVGGELVTYLSPWEPEAWAHEIWRMLADPALRKERETQVRQHYRARTWEGAALSVKEAIDSLG